MNQELFDKLIAPIPGDHPCGEDISYLPVFDEIREARRQDDPSLVQGEWETSLKVAQWPKVRELCEDILHKRSKDLQVACWHTEALTHLHGFEGIDFGFRVIDILLTDFWEFCYPAYDPADLDERSGKIGWLNKQLPLAIRSIPLTTKDSGGHSWLAWEESRSVENLGLKDNDAKEKAIASGKLSAEVFDAAASASGLAFYEKLLRQIRAALQTVTAVETHVDERFGSDSHGLKDVRAAISDAEDVAGRIITRLGGNRDAQPASDSAATSVVTTHSERHATIPPAGPYTHGPIRSRADAIAALRQVSGYFKQNEPHSPVGLLAERAARWAEMPLERWLTSVIKDDSTLNQLKELLDIPRDH